MGAAVDKYVFNRFGFGSHNAISDWVRPGTRVLDVGCASGYLMAHLAASKGCQPVGIESDPEYAARAVAVTGLPIVHSDALSALRSIEGPFDHIVFADVLEHIADPAPVLRAAVSALAADGTILISLPNIAFVKSRVRIAMGIWRYEDSGIFDRTHLRFFTVESGRQFVQEAGYRIQREVFVGPLTHRGGKWGLKVNALRPGVLANQMIFEVVAQTSVDERPAG